jgi:recombinational DNA repair protein (RecF pathway)
MEYMGFVEDLSLFLVEKSRKNNRSLGSRVQLLNLLLLGASSSINSLTTLHRYDPLKTFGRGELRSPLNKTAPGQQTK